MQMATWHPGPNSAMIGGTGPNSAMHVAKLHTLLIVSYCQLKHHKILEYSAMCLASTLVVALDCMVQWHICCQVSLLAWLSTALTGCCWQIHCSAAAGSVILDQVATHSGCQQQASRLKQAAC